MADASDLFLLAAEVLDVATAALDLLPAQAPDRRYVGHGLPALDCEQLVVSTYAVPEASTAPQAAALDRSFRFKYGSVINPLLVVSVVRCYPVVTLNSKQVPIFPDPAAIEAASALIYADGWQLWNGIISAKREGAFDGLCKGMAREPMLPIQPSGGYAGWTMPLDFELDGFTVDFGS